MDDGGKTDYSGQSKGIDMHTQGFTADEVNTLSKELNDKFGFNSWVTPNKGKLIIRISSKEYSKFIELVDPYIHPGMRYKLPK